MSSETDSPAMDAGNESANASDIDNPENWNFLDPDEDQDNEDDLAEPETDSEENPASDEEAEPAEESEDQAEEEDGESEPEDEGDETAGSKISDDVKVSLKDGTEVTLAELRDGYYRQADYSRKTVELANKRKDLEAQADRVNRTVEAFATFISEQIPEEPPISLSVTNPNEYVRQKAAYDATMAQVNTLLEMGNTPKAVKEGMSEGDRREVLAQENQRLIQAFPETAEPEGRKAFFDSAFSAARELGFADDETRNVTDHRIFALAHWAKKGMEAEKARKTAKKKVENVPPVAPPKRAKTNGPGKQSKVAMDRLSKSGSIFDAVKVDFD